MAPEEIEAMVVDYRSGIGSWRLARKYGVSSSTVLTRLRTAGVELDIAQTTSAKHGLITDEMARLRESGWTYKAIGAKYGVTRQAVKMRLDRAMKRRSAT
jgi:DNA-binding transcriptional regulator LsrR (DeoR family)